MEKHGGGWTVIQRRIKSNNIDFFRSWEEYRVGFGNRSLSFWIGLDNMHSITNTTDYELNIEYMECYENTTKEVMYSSFKVGPLLHNTLWRYLTDFYRIKMMQ
uniref:microfibril-associated glycoprotein 4-like isoform X2 n=1 Tax=Ciona intestinalis TaxID=7719 RepID=UPI000EF54935|nr:microfibril-associated glycoprotein 4-like isoform X2 [Ciona intestinalis]|eukprot:XP_026690130.1 microfibril-associated glycoprotein 4-like isoform X2 [Ciona intestinalis]